LSIDKGLFLYLTMAKRRKKKSTRQITALLLFLSVLVGSYFVYSTFLKREITPIEFSDLPTLPPGFKSYGIDISHHQSEVNWDTFFEENDSTIQFIYCKVTEGETLIDREWQNNHTRLFKEKMPHGGYHFFRPSIDPVVQANHFLKHYNFNETNLPPALDVEIEGATDASLIQNMTIWLNLIERATGKRPLIYTSYNFYTEKFKGHFENYKFWVANYSNHAYRFVDDQIIHWQFSETGEIPGIKGFVDLNYSKIDF